MGNGGYCKNETKGWWHGVGQPMRNGIVGNALTNHAMEQENMQIPKMLY